MCGEEGEEEIRRREKGAKWKREKMDNRGKIKEKKIGKKKSVVKRKRGNKEIKEERCEEGDEEIMKGEKS